jgi:phytoene desaturase
VLEFAGVDFISGILRAGILDSYGDFVKKSFQNKFIRQMLEFPVLFLGATPAKTPKIYTLMAWTCLKQGTFYPSGGMGKLVDALTGLAKSLGVKFLTNTEIIKIESEK